MIIVLASSCESSGSLSWYSYSYPSYETSLFDFNPIFGSKRKLAEYFITRDFSQVEAGIYDGVLLNPANYPEDEEADPYYRINQEEETSSSVEPIDYSDEVIEFAPQNYELANLIDSFTDGELDSDDIDSIINSLDINDDFINHQTIEFESIILYHDFFNGQYYAFNNNYEVENRSLTRYENDIIAGSGNATILYQDGFSHSYTIEEQILATGFKIYEMRDETFPPGSTLAEDYKITSNRVSGNYKQALTLGGGGRAIRFISERIEEYETAKSESSEQFASMYSYQLDGSKQGDEVSLVFTSHIDQHIDETNSDVYEMDLSYEITIEGGILTRIASHQTYWSNID
jgi:hypothetical protein